MKYYSTTKGFCPHQISTKVGSVNLYRRTHDIDFVCRRYHTPMYVLTNPDKIDGAAVLARDGVVEKIAELVDTNYFVLPSSIHEVLIVPDNGNIQAKKLTDMVREINRTQVSPEERLSDKIQYYDRETGQLGHKQEKSVLERLTDHKGQIRQSDTLAKAKQTHKNDPSL